MTINYKIRDEKLQYDINKEAAKMSALLSGEIDKYEFFTGEEILPSDQSRIIEQVKFTYSPLGKAFQKQIKTIEDPGEKLDKHRKQLLKSSSEKESLTLLKPKEVFEELAIERIDEIQKLSKQIYFNNSTYFFVSESAPEIFFSVLKIH